MELVPGTRKDANWDTAYGWGNHASAGYSTASGVEDNANNDSLPVAGFILCGGCPYSLVLTYRCS